ncbi:hypothetical protein CB1_000998022 [Camelus ferus]|nr:hypothetical protein CB1_000998022 [Camelus ferus]
MVLGHGYLYQLERLPAGTAGPGVGIPLGAGVQATASSALTADSHVVKDSSAEDELCESVNLGTHRHCGTAGDHNQFARCTAAPRKKPERPFSPSAVSPELLQEKRKRQTPRWKSLWTRQGKVLLVTDHGYPSSLRNEVLAMVTGSVKVDGYCPGGCRLLLRVLPDARSSPSYTPQDDVTAVLAFTPVCLGFRTVPGLPETPRLREAGTPSPAPSQALRKDFKTKAPVKAGDTQQLAACTPVGDTAWLTALGLTWREPSGSLPAQRNEIKSKPQIHSEDLSVGGPCSSATSPNSAQPACVVLVAANSKSTRDNRQEKP